MLSAVWTTSGRRDMRSVSSNVCQLRPSSASNDDGSARDAEFSYHHLGLVTSCQRYGISALLSQSAPTGRVGAKTALNLAISTRRVAIVVL